MKPRNKKLLAALAVGTLIGVGSAAFINSSLLEKQAPDIQGLLWPNPRVLEPFAITDHQRQQFSLGRLRGKWSFLFFGYTHCPDVCPLTLAKLDKVSRMIRETPAAGGDVQFVFVSVDPARDTPEKLAAYVNYFNAEFIGATGADENLMPLTRQLGIFFERDPPDSNGDYSVAHSSAVLLIDPEGSLLAVFQAPHDPADVAKRFRQIREFIEG
jgi:protein SCO1/2